MNLIQLTEKKTNKSIHVNPKNLTIKGVDERGTHIITKINGEFFVKESPETIEELKKKV